MLIRQESRTDYKRIRELNDAAFGGMEESQLIDSLRGSGKVLLSLVPPRIRKIRSGIFSSAGSRSSTGAVRRRR